MPASRTCSVTMHSSIMQRVTYAALPMPRIVQQLERFKSEIWILNVRKI